jgi:signal transduction histidine kinase
MGLAVGLALLQVLGTRAAAYGQAAPRLDELGYALLVAGPLALIPFRRLPLVALAGALAATAVYFARGYPVGPGFVAAIVAIAFAMRTANRSLVLLMVAVAFAGYATYALARPDPQSVRHVVVAGIGCLVTLAFAEAGRARAAQWAEISAARLEQQRRARAEEERAQQEQARRQASEERLLIARELHDVLGHHLSLINVQAGVGLHLMDERPEQARAALAAIKHASAEALRETRAVLAALNPREQSAPRAPAPTIADLEPLVADVTAAGLPVTVEASGAPRSLPPEVDRAAFRIVQEALTNVRRHAGPSATASIHIGYGQSAVTVDISDNGVGCPPAEATGNGIAGMRERALALGGTVSAGPGAAGGFEVRARLPIPEETT